MIDVIHRDKDIPKEVIFASLEDALALGVRKRLGAGEDLVVAISANNYNGPAFGPVLAGFFQRPTELKDPGGH